MTGRSLFREYHRPSSMPPVRSEGDTLWRMRQTPGETSDEAVRRAARMPWWRLIPRRRRKPTWSAGWWCWAGKQSEASADPGAKRARTRSP